MQDGIVFLLFVMETKMYALTVEDVNEVSGGSDAMDAAIGLAGIAAGIALGVALAPEAAIVGGILVVGEVAAGGSIVASAIDIWNEL